MGWRRPPTGRSPVSPPSISRLLHSALSNPATLQISYSALYIFPSAGQKSITGLPHSTLCCSANILLFCVFYRQITLAAFYSPLSTSAHSYWQFPLQSTLIECEYFCRASWSNMSAFAEHPDRVRLSLPTDPPPESRMHISGQH